MSKVTAGNPGIARNGGAARWHRPLFAVFASGAQSFPWLRLVSGGVAAAMLLWLCFSSARLLWVLLPGPVPATSDTTPVLNQAALALPAGTSDATVDLATVVSLPFAGVETARAMAAQAPERSDKAQATLLPLTLRGTVASSDPKAARAIIAEGDRQAVAVPGEQLPISTQGVSLIEVAVDHIIIDNNGRRETLWISDSAASSPATSAAATVAVAEPGASTVPVAGLGLPPVFAEAASFQLHQTPDGREGLLARAKGDGRLFRRLGMRNDDIVLSVNQYSVLDSALAAALQQSLREGGNIQLQLLRDGQTINTVLDPSVLASAGE
ncbi:MAG: type II secretion system protein N [Pseudohongiellaceae bacterium]